jgi:hypothetical protein
MISEVVNMGNRGITEMTIKKCSLILVITASMLVAISSGFTDSEWGWTSVPAAPSNTNPFGFGDYKPVTFGEGWINSDYVPVNLSEYFFGPDQVVPEKTNPLDKWEPVPIVMPQPLNISKDELIKSKPIISTQKQPLISSLSSSGRRSIFF